MALKSMTAIYGVVWESRLGFGPEPELTWLCLALL